MHAPRLIAPIAALLLLGPAAATAFDPRLVSILGLRLGMTRQDMLNRLASQGINSNRIHEESGPCDGDAAATCVRLLAARTVDGDLLVRFATRAGPGSETAWSIAYTLAGRGAGEPEMIRKAVMDRFGPPSSRDPPVWCARPGSRGCTVGDQPQLTYREGPGTSSTLMLSDPGAQ